MELRTFLFWCVAIAVLVFDRIPKLLVLHFVELNSSVKVASFLSVFHVLNTGTAFGLFRNASWFFMLFAVAVSLYILVRLRFFVRFAPVLSALVFAGAVGNLIDRVLYGAVVDFIDFHFWPAFNVADSAISVAVVFFLLREFLGKYGRYSEKFK